MDMPMRPSTISRRSRKLPLVAAATSPMAMLPKIQKTAAPMTRESVTGAAPMISGTTTSPRFTKEVRSWSMKSRRIITAYWMGSGLSRPKLALTAASTSGEALRPAMREAGSAPGVAKKIRKTRMLMPSMTKIIWAKRRMSRLTIGSADSELGARVERVAQAVAQDVEGQHRQHDGDAGRDRDPGPGIDQILAVLDDRAPARIRRLDADREERQGRFGQHVDRDHERHENDDRRHHIGQDVAQENPPVGHAQALRRQHEFALLQRQDLAADRPRHIGDVDDGDDPDRQPETPGGDLEGADGKSMADEHDGKRDRQQIDGERPEHVEQARDQHVGDAAEEAGDKPGERGKEQADDRRGAADEKRIAPAVKQARRDIAALGIGAEEIGMEVPGRAQRHRAQAQALGRRLDQVHVLAV